MNNDQTTISCPNCGTSINVADVYQHQADERLQKKISEANAKLQKERDALEESKLQQDDQIKRAIKEKELALTEKIKREAGEEQQEAMALLKNELEEKSKKVKELNRAEAELEKLKREKDELAEEIQAKSEKRLNEILASEKERIQKQERNKQEFELKTLQKQLEDQKLLTEEMKRKQEQGSMQTQGEVQELAIEEWLASHFPLDTIEEIRKGERGADCLQNVHTRTRQNCGSIYYESKRTKSFQPSWIEKFKADIQARGASIGVLVTEAMPSDMERLGLKDGVWICSYDEFKGLSTVLRESVIQVSAALVTRENKGDKMGMLYDYLTSQEFQMQMEAIVDGFTQMKTDLDSEQRAMHKIWKKREKQIEKVLLNCTGMHGSIRGIAGSAVHTIPALELPVDDADPERLDFGE